MYMEEAGHDREADGGGESSGAAGGDRAAGRPVYIFGSTGDGHGSPAAIAGAKAGQVTPGAAKGGSAHDRAQEHPQAAQLATYSPSPDYDSCRSLINSYFYQITMGCGTVHCTNRNCFSSPDGPRLDPTSAALLAVKLAQSTTHFLCAGAAIIIPESLQWVQLPANNDIIPLKRLFEAASQRSNVQAQVEVAATLRRCLSSPECLCWSFLRDGKPCRATELTSGIDYGAVEEAYATLLQSRTPLAIVNAQGELTDSTLTDVVAASFEQLFKGAVVPAFGAGAPHRFEPLRVFMLVLLWPGLMEPEHHNTIFKKLCSGMNCLSQEQRETLQEWLREVKAPMLRDAIVAFQQFITIYVNEYRCIDDHVASATKVLGILWRSNRDSKRVCYKEFYNDAINELVDFTEDFSRWKDTQRCSFSFCAHPFVLDPGTKSKLLQLDANNQMRSQIRGALFRSIFGGNECPYLILRVRRENLIRDTLLQISALHNQQEDLKKPLKVIFKGEEGIDEGGVQKEFFQLIVRQMFDLNYGMFTYDEESHCFWFSATALENAREFNLIGKVFGLAIYNSVILDVHFPMVVYRKLMGCKPTLQDLHDCNPQLARGLQMMLEFDGDVEETFARTFVVSYEEYGTVKTHPLKPGGDDTPVTNQNRHEYVELYIQYLLEDSISLQFSAFAEGFHEVCGGPALRMFIPEELELLICGNPSLDFLALEEVASTEDGYTRDHPVIVNFWKVVHSMTLEEKKRLLFFCTGSDRSPIRGLGSMTFIISRNGPDSDRLPTAHTCFNHLLLPEYRDLETLRRCLMTAINNSEGFGLM